MAEHTTMGRDGLWALKRRIDDVQNVIDRFFEQTPDGQEPDREAMDMIAQHVIDLQDALF
jgi:hypothetical protein